MTKIVAYKGFDAQLQCRNFEFELNKSYTHDGPVIACEQGFHACAYPLDIFGYYPPATSRYGEVELSGDTNKQGSDTKIAAAEITIKCELKIPELVAAAVRYVIDRTKRVDGNHATGERELIKAQGDRSVATVTGNWSAATVSGDQSAATALGDWSAATATGWRSAATASGNWSAATASGDRSAATATGISSAATATGYEGKVRGKEGCALFLVERNDNMEIVSVWSGIAGRDGIKPDTFYTLKSGQPVETD